MIRLDKVLAHMGFGTRKEVKKLIRDGLVLVNGNTVFNDDLKIDIELDEINILDEKVEYKKYTYILLNKPEGYISATFDYNKPIVLDLISDNAKGLFPVGRLDIDSIGLLLITNDGMLAHRMLSPKSHVEKTYYIEFSGNEKDNFKDLFNEGIILDDGYKCKPAIYESLGSNKAYITLIEGKFHQVKRMMESLNCNVLLLKRIKFGPLLLNDDLELGKYRYLSQEEIDELKKI